MWELMLHNRHMDSLHSAQAADREEQACTE